MNSEPTTGVAFVTGASRGIGAAIARKLAQDGMAVAMNSHPDEPMVRAAQSVAAEIRREGGRAAVYPADVTEPDAIDAMFTACEQEFGPVTALVLNAAATGRLTWLEISDSAWDTVMSVNLKGAFFCCRRAFGSDSAPINGSVVTLSSVQAKLGAPNALHYATTKAGILGFTRSLAREVGSRGIRVNCVMPGAIQTEEELEAFPDQDAVRSTVLGNQIIQRRGLPDDIASVVSFLVGPESAFITGQTICVDGGWVLL